MGAARALIEPERTAPAVLRGDLEAGTTKEKETRDRLRKIIEKIDSLEHAADEE